MRRKNVTSPNKRMKITLKNISTCLLAVASLLFFTIPVSLYVIVSLVQGAANNTKLAAMWIGTAHIMNATFNSLIFFWKNNILRLEGLKTLNQIKNYFLDEQNKFVNS